MKCGFYEKEITPPLGGDMPGYYSHRYTTAVEDKLYAKTVVFSASGEAADAAAIIVLDVVELPPEFCEAVRARGAELSGIPADHIVISANHSHYGMTVGDCISDADEEYVAVAARLIGDTVELARQRLQPCKLTYGIGEAKNVCYVRDYVLDDGCIVTNASKYLEHIIRPYSEPDEDLPVLAAYDEEGKPLGALFTLALHQDTTGKKAYSGDYSSEVSKQLKAVYGPEFVSVYLPGFSGDVNHCDTMGRKAMKQAIDAGEAEETAALKYNKLNHRKIGKVVAEAVQKVMEEGSEPIEGDRVAAMRTDRAFPCRHASEEELAHARWVAEDQKNRKDKYDMTGQNSSLMLLYEEAFKGVETFNLPIQTLQIGEVTLFATPGEIYHQYGARLKEKRPKWLIAELCNTAIGYVPIPEIHGTYAYPAQLCHGSFLMPEAGDQIMDTLLEMADQLTQ